MKAANLEDLSNLLLSEHAIPNTYEFPGYINIRYRGSSVVVGIEVDEMLVQIACDDGTAIPVDDSSVIDLNVYGSMEEVAPVLKQILTMAYKTIDRVLF
jgi:hypothetical protein